MKPGRKRKSKKHSKKKAKKHGKRRFRIPPAKEVEIQKLSHGGVGVNQDPVDLSKHGQEHMKWKSKEDWLVVFPSGSPFKDWYFDKNHPNSGPIRKDAAYGNYKYVVVIDGALLDPGVVIGP